MELAHVAAALGAALAAGLVVGFERELQVQANGESQLGGARTFPLIALIGALAGLLSSTFGPWPAVAGLLALVALMGVRLAVRAQPGDHKGITTETAAVVVFFLGVVAGADVVFDQPREKLVGTVGIGVVVALLLSIKPKVQALARKITSDDVFAALQLGMVGTVVVPLLPDQGYGPYAALNPFRTGLMILMIAGISFAGFASTRMLGPGRGLALTGLVGGLASSTAVTFAMSRRARKEPSVAPTAALAVIIASTIMFARIVVEVAVVDPALVKGVVPPMAAMAAAGVLAALVLRKRARDDVPASEELALKNPFELKSAIVFGLIYGVVQLVSKAATDELGATGLYLTALVAGATDVDAITLSVANLTKTGLDHGTALWTLLLAAASNMVVKAGVAVVLGGRRFGLTIVIAYAVMIAAGTAGVLVGRAL